MNGQYDYPLEIEGMKTGKKMTVTARRNGEAVHMDTIDPTSANQRQRFIEAVCSKIDQADPEKIDATLMQMADAENHEHSPSAPGSPPELDTSCIIRPEQFITADLTGVTIPVVIDIAGKATPTWMLYLRWADGRRECRELIDSIDLPGGSKLRIHPIPGEPSMTAKPGWTAKARQSWLDGSPTPDPADLFKRVCERIAYFIDFPPDVASGTTATLALWLMLSYVFQAWDAAPYLYVGGPQSSGKTRLLEILARLVYRPLQSSNLTAPALFRTLHERGGVVLLDEAERLKQSTPDVGEIMSMLLAGYRRGGQATRLEAVGETFRTVFFDVYAPKVLACIAGLPPVLASRCIPIGMFRADPESDKPKRRIDADPVGWQALRDDLHALALEYGTCWMDLSGRSNICPSTISGRGYELWQPLLALAWWIESKGAAGLLALMQRFALESLDKAKDDQISDADETLLEVLADMLRVGDNPTPGEIHERAKELDRTTFDRWTPRTVSNRLKTYGIVIRKVDRRREYRDDALEKLKRVQANYGVDLGFPHPAASSRASRCVPETPISDPESPVTGRSGTKRDEA